MKLTPENKKLIGFGLILLLLIVFIYAMRDKPVVKKITDKFKKPVTPPLVAGTTTPTTQTAPATTPTTKPQTDVDFNVVPAVPVADDSFPLHKGSKGERVKILQQALNRILNKSGKNYAPLAVDSAFGDKLSTAIITWVGTRFMDSTGVSQNNFNAILQQSIA